MSSSRVKFNSYCGTLGLAYFPVRQYRQNERRREEERALEEKSHKNCDLIYDRECCRGGGGHGESRHVRNSDNANYANYANYAAYANSSQIIILLQNHFHVHSVFCNNRQLYSFNQLSKL